jgi:hypothetical protein
MTAGSLIMSAQPVIQVTVTGGKMGRAPINF